MINRRSFFAALLAPVLAFFGLRKKPEPKFKYKSVMYKGPNGTNWGDSPYYKIHSVDISPGVTMVGYKVRGLRDAGFFYAPYIPKYKMMPIRNNT